MNFFLLYVTAVGFSFLFFQPFAFLGISLQKNEGSSGGACTQRNCSCKHKSLASALFLVFQSL